MPTEFFTFSPQSTGTPYQFVPTLDGSAYLATVKWNTFGERWYVALDTMSGQRIFNQALVGSQPAIQIQSLDWENGAVTMICAFPHSFKIGDTNIISVQGCAPVGYNGSFLAYALDPVTLVYPVADPPGDVTLLGLTAYDINLAGGYFQQSTLVFRQGTQQFEVFSP